MQQHGVNHGYRTARRLTPPFSLSLSPLIRGVIRGVILMHPRHRVHGNGDGGPAPGDPRGQPWRRAASRRRPIPTRVEPWISGPRFTLLDQLERLRVEMIARGVESPWIAHRYSLNVHRTTLYSATFHRRLSRRFLYPGLNSIRILRDSLNAPKRPPVRHFQWWRFLVNSDEPSLLPTDSYPSGCTADLFRETQENFPFQSEVLVNGSLRIRVRFSSWRIHRLEYLVTVNDQSLNLGVSCLRDWFVNR